MSRAKRNPRRGVAAVEFALLLPVFVLLVLGTIEATSMIFLQQSLEIAAYEGARIALVPDSTDGNVEGAARQILDARNVQGSTTTVKRGYSVRGVEGVLDLRDPEDRAVFMELRRQRLLRRGNIDAMIQVSVEESCDENSLFAPWFFAGQTLSADVALRRDR